MTAPAKFTSIDIAALTRRMVAEDAANQDRKAARIVKANGGGVDDMLLRSIWADEPVNRWRLDIVALIVGAMIGAVLVGYAGNLAWDAILKW